MSYRPIDDRQVINRQSLPNIGAPAGDSLDDILALIDAALSGISGGKTYTAKTIALTSGMGTTSYTVTIPAQPDLSYVVFAMFENDVDLFPQYQQIEATNKTVNGFTFQWNSSLLSNNYTINFIIPPITTTVGESSILGSSSSVTVTLPIPQNGPNYGVLSTVQNLVDPLPQFQTPVLTAQTGTNFTEQFNAPTSSSSYQLVYMTAPTAQVAVPMGVTSITVTLPVAYGSTGYSAVASLSDTVDSFPLFQPMVVTSKSGSQVTFSWNVPTVTSSVVLTYYAISVTP